MTGFYLHIPFCEKKCHYCDFVTTAAGSAAKRGDFLSVLEKEVRHAAPLFQNTFFDTLYLGGGTPSALALGEMERLFGFIRENFKFKDDAEITCEVNPGDIDNGKARGLRRLGIRRVSLGAQSFRGATLRRLNRSHGADALRRTFAALREEGFNNINVDLMLSLPGETLEDVRYSLDQTAVLDPEHVSLYELTIEAHTVFGRRFQSGNLPLPDEALQWEMLLFARRFLVERGFGHYELLNYAKPGCESRHNLLYWANGEYLGLGPGAFSYLDGRRFRNASNFDEYMRKIKNEDWTAFEEEILTPEKKEVESFLLALRLSEGAPLARFEEVMNRLQGPIGDLQEKGLLTKRTDAICFTEQGKLFAETVFAELSIPDLS